MSGLSQPTSSANLSQAGPRHHCVLLTDPTAVPADLLRGLEHKGVRIQIASNPAGVMVALAEDRPNIVIVNDPARQPQYRQLLAAVARHYPKVICWQYQLGPDRQPQLTALHEDAPSPAPLTPPRRVPPARTKTTIAKPTSSPTPPPRTPPPSPRTPPPVPAAAPAPVLTEETPSEPLFESDHLLTAEEISMLLGSDFGSDDVSPTPTQENEEPHPQR
ncbi:MAG: hypothetical protein IT443_08250 [Phycisphaeraceae bacterium]|nr:hypothetical protein [Phycisphaeraceae bacterium]